MSKKSQPPVGDTINRAVGYAVVEVTNSNINGDPDRDGAPRHRPDELGESTAVSTKRKFRDVVMFKNGPVWKAIEKALGLDPDKFKIFERPDRPFNKSAPSGQTPALEYAKSGKVLEECWDARTFGIAFFGDKEDDKNQSVVSRGTIQIGMGLSISPVRISERTITRGMPVQSDKTRGMGSLALKTVDHAIYVIPIFVNPSQAVQNGTTATDIEVFKYVFPHIFSATMSATRPQVNLLHVHWVEHSTPLGDCPDHLILDALMPKRKDDGERPSMSREQYDIPDKLPASLTRNYPTLKHIDLVKIVPNAQKVA